MKAPNTKRIVLYISPVETPLLSDWIETIPAGQRNQAIRSVLAWAIQSPLAGALPATAVAIEPVPQTHKPAPKPKAPKAPDMPFVESDRSVTVTEATHAEAPTPDHLSTDDLAAFDKLWNIGG